MKGTSNIYSLSRHNWCESTPHCLEKNALRCFKRLFRSRLLQFFLSSPQPFLSEPRWSTSSIRVNASCQSCASAAAFRAAVYACKTKLIEQPRFVLPGDLFLKKNNLQVYKHQQNGVWKTKVLSFWMQPSVD